jgi:hypothetical protein
VEQSVSVEVEDGNVCRSRYDPDESDDVLKLVIGGNEGTVDTTTRLVESILKLAIHSEDRLGRLLHVMQRDGVIENFDIQSFLAFAKEKVQSRKAEEVDYPFLCRRSWKGRGDDGRDQAMVDRVADLRPVAKGSKERKWGFWISTPMSEERSGVRRTADPYGGLM